MLGEFAPIASYLGVPLGPEPAAVPAAFRRVARTCARGDWQNWFTPEDVECFRPRLTPYLVHNGYGTDWTLPERPRILPAHGSEHVARLVGERRRPGPS